MEVHLCFHPLLKISYNIFSFYIYSSFMFDFFVLSIEEKNIKLDQVLSRFKREQKNRSLETIVKLISHCIYSPFMFYKILLSHKNKTRIRTVPNSLIRIKGFKTLKLKSNLLGKMFVKHQLSEHIDLKIK